MRMLVVFAHPVPESFGAALCHTAIESLTEAGHEVRLIDLHAEAFDPVMGTDERRTYHDGESTDPTIRAHVAQLKWAEGMLFVYPTWWYSQPAILKGWLDRVWRPGATFTVPSEEKGLRPALTNVRFIGVVTTLGSPRWFWTFLIGAPGRKIILRGLRACTHPMTRTLWMGLHDMDTVSQARREKFLAKVRRRLSRIGV